MLVADESQIGDLSHPEAEKYLMLVASVVESQIGNLSNRIAEKNLVDSVKRQISGSVVKYFSEIFPDLPPESDSYSN